MTSATCPSCGARFDDLSFEPGTQFECGACHALVTVPDATPRKITPVAPAAAPAPAARRPAGPARGVQRGAGPRGAPSRGASRAAAAPKKANKLPLILGGSGLGVVLVVLLIVVASSSDEERSPQGANGAATAGNGAAAQEEPKSAFELALSRARKVTASVEDRLTFAAMAYEEWEEAEDPERKDEMRRYWRGAYKKVLEDEPENRIANERLGHVHFDLAEARKILESSEHLSTKTQTELEFFIDDISHGADELLGTDGKAWLREGNDDEEVLAKDWARIEAMIARDEEEHAARQSDGFYAKAQRQGDRLADELSIDILRFPGVEGRAFEVIVGKPYVILVQKDPVRGRERQIGERISRACEDLERQFYERYGEGADLAPVTGVRPIVVLRDQTNYKKYIRRTDSSRPVISRGHFEPASNSKRIVIYLNTEDDDREVLFHEGTHALVDWGMRNLGPMAGLRQSLWFSEGIAEFFGGHARGTYDELKGWTYDLGLINEGSVATIADALERGDFMPIEELLDYSRADYQRDSGDPTKSRKVGVAYAQGWALCFLLQKWHAEKYADRFVEYARREFDGETGKSAFTAVFGAESLSTIENELKEMVKDLDKARKEGRIVNGRVRKD